MQYIKISTEQKQSILKQFELMLDKGRFSNGRIKFDEPFDKVLGNIIKPTVLFTPEAWLKIQQLVQKADGEIGWHGVIEHNADLSVYTVKDILVYPQTVTGATVTTDELEYGQWLMNFDDEIFEHIRYQGHSHVNFGTSPSGVDQQFYDNILQTLQAGDYYIFMIINKRNDLTVLIYDFSQNIIFENADIQTGITCKGGTMKTWAEEEMKAKVKTFKRPETPAPSWQNPHIKISTPTYGDSMSMSEYYRSLSKEAEQLDSYWEDGYGIRHYDFINPKTEGKRGPGRPPKEDKTRGHK